MRARLRAALELAGQQLVALQLGDVEAFLDGSGAHQAACEALVPLLSAEPVEREDSLLLEQLVATNRLVSGALAGAMDEVSGRLANMNRARGATGAYLPSWQSGLSGVREA